MGYVVPMFWIVALLLVLVASGAFVVPLVRQPAMVDGRAERNALEAELGEAQRDRARGLIGEHEFDLARAEIARRLFRLEDRGQRKERAWRATPAVLVACAVALPAASLALYAALGAPARPDEPLASRGDLPALVARAQSHLRRNPDDARGWLAIAPALRAMNRTQEAAAAYEAALANGTFDPRRRSALMTELAELRLAEANGRVAPVVAQLQEALALDGGNEKAAYYLALAAEQDGDRAAGAAAWRGLLERFPDADAPWVAVAKRKVVELSAPPGPTRERAAAVAALPQAEQRAMIDGMVASLAAKLEADPDDAAGWPRLVRSLAVLGRTDEARKALADARSHLAGDREAETQLDALARDFAL